MSVGWSAEVKAPQARRIGTLDRLCFYKMSARDELINVLLNWSSFAISRPTFAASLLELWLRTFDSAPKTRVRQRLCRHE
jgi:hypothetical protein